LLIDTFDGEPGDGEFFAKTAYALRPCSMALFRVTNTAG
jgi:hypothetical protein